MLVSTDGMTRGMDIGELQDHNRPTPSLSHKSQSQSQGQCQGGSADGASVQDGHAGVDVVSYDAPVYPKTLLHRMGRTARAGRAGRYFTLLRKEEVRLLRPRNPVRRPLASPARQYSTVLVTA